MTESVKLATGETLTFDPINHVYTIDGELCGGTGALMEKFGIVKPLSAFTAPYAERGSRIDLAIQFDIVGDLDESSVDSSEWGYIEAWRLFVKEHHVKPMDKPQLLVGSAQLWYASLIDLPCYIDGAPSTLNEKTGKESKAHPVQCHLEGILYPDAEKVQAVYLAADGSYRLHDYTPEGLAQSTARAIAQANGIAHRYMATRRPRTVKI